MAIETHINDSGTWKEALEIHVNDSGTWKEVLEEHVNDSGTWKLAFASVPSFPSPSMGADFSLIDNQTDPNTANVRIKFTTDGDIETSVALAAFSYDRDWSDDNPSLVGNDFEIRCETFANGDPDSLLVDTWYSLGIDRTWTYDQPSVGINTGTVDFIIRQKTDVGNNDTLRVTMTADVEGGA